MADQSAFDRNKIETSAMSETSGILDQLNLPPAVVSFLQKNQRMLWIIVAVLAVSVTAVSLYGSYRNYQINKATSALDAALLATGDTSADLLQQITEKYSATPSALWARIELAKIAVNKEDLAGAIAQLQVVNSRLTAKDSLKPLVLYRLAGLHEKMRNFTAAIGLYQELTAFSGFAADAHYAMGRVYVAMDQKTEAVEQYQKYLSLTEEAPGGVMRQPDPQRTLVEYTIKKLQ